MINDISDVICLFISEIGTKNKVVEAADAVALLLVFTDTGSARTHRLGLTCPNNYTSLIGLIKYN